MPSLRQLLSLHPALLVIDTSSTQVEAALWLAGACTPAQTATREAEACVGLPDTVGRVLSAAGLGIRDLDAIAFCAGPGSVLGIRLAAASLRAWRAIKPTLGLYSYRSLPLLASAHPGMTVIADARRETWHVVRADPTRVIHRMPSADLASLGPLGSPAGFRRWSTPPADLEIHPLPYSAHSLLVMSPDEVFFETAPEPEAFSHEAPTYVTWTPQVHQAPTHPAS